MGDFFQSPWSYWHTSEAFVMKSLGILDSFSQFSQMSWYMRDENTFSPIENEILNNLRPEIKRKIQVWSDFSHMAVNSFSFLFFLNEASRELIYPGFLPSQIYKWLFLVVFTPLSLWTMYFEPRSTLISLPLVRAMIYIDGYDLHRVMTRLRAMIFSMIPDPFEGDYRSMTGLNDFFSIHDLLRRIWLFITCFFS